MRREGRPRRVEPSFATGSRRVSPLPREPVSQEETELQTETRLWWRPGPRLTRFLGLAFSLGIAGLSLFILARTLANISFTDLRAAVAATSAEQIAAAGLLTACSFLALTGYDALALRQLRTYVPYRTTALASFTSYAISFTLGFPLITGGTVRYWIYSQAGLRAAKVASLTIIAGVS